ncbi:right-handed parallel beta-helix repeat-containing protein [Sinomicrobium sp. M5D2P9]
MRFITFTVLCLLCVYTNAQNCIQVNTTNISGINTIINNLSSTGGGCIEIEAGDYFAVPAISLKSDIVLKIYGRLHRDYNIISVTNCENISIIGDNTGSLIYNSNNPNTTAKGLEIKNSKNVNIEGLNIRGFEDKGILIRGSGTTNITVTNNTVSGAVSSTGVGIAVSDDLGGVSFCTIKNNTVYDNRIGISVNKSRHINILQNHCRDNSIHGIGLDGITSLSGDGPQNCIISGNQVYNNGGTCVTGSAKAGIYLGNGSQKNIISHNMIKNNKCHGILYFEETNNSNSAYNNSFINNQIINNEQWGIRLVRMKRGIISNNQIIDNGSGGIQLDNSNSNIISSNNIILNGEIGVFFKNSTNNKCPDELNIIEGQTQKYKYE